MLNAEWLTTLRYVLVEEDLKEIHSLDALM